MAGIKQKLAICDDFNNRITRLVRLAENKLRDGNADLYILREHIRVARDVDPLMIINLCMDSIWALRGRIENQDHEYFLNPTNEEINKLPMIAAVLKATIGHLNDDEKIYVWQIIRELLSLVVRYKLLIGDYHDA